MRKVEAKRAAEGTEREAECRRECSACIVTEYYKYLSRERTKLQEMPRGTKGWWSKSSRLMGKKVTVSSVPALRGAENEWVLDAKLKADLIVQTFCKKAVLRVAEANDYTELDSPTRTQTNLQELQQKNAEDIMKKLRADSGTGPDRLPARILKMCAAELAKPVLMLFTCILQTGVWP